MIKKFSALLPVLSLGLATGFGVGIYSAPSDLVSQPPKPAQQDSVPRKLARGNGRHVFSVKTKLTSYFKKSADGGLIPKIKAGKRYFEAGENTYDNVRAINSVSSALVVMDPWEDAGSEFLNEYYTPIYRRSILPLVKQALDLSITVIVLTNDPKKNYADYGGAVYPELHDMAEQKKINILFHQDFDDDTFAKLLRKNSIDTLIYSGFASNMCVIGRPMGMIHMLTHGFRLLFVPEASAAVEFKDSWRTGAAHKATTAIISSWIAEIIALDDLMGLKPD